MKPKIFRMFWPLMTILCVALLAAPLSGGEATSLRQGPMGADNPSSESCTGWLNCDARSPNFTGICCRCCTDKAGNREWECRDAFAETTQRPSMLVGQPPDGEATLAGIVTREGLLQAEDGLAYAVAGEKAGELHRNMGRRVEVKGTVEEVQGRVTIEVEAYELVVAGGPGVATYGSCTEWMNCDSRPPTFTGTCCRECKDETGATLWDCRVFSPDEHFNLAEWLRAE